MKAEAPAWDAPEPIWRAAHAERLANVGLGHIPLLWGRPPWVRNRDLPSKLPRGISRSDCGIALLHDGAAVVLPQCCTDFGGLQSWREPLEDDHDEGWQMLWIGHPWINWKRDGDQVLLTDFCEDDEVAGRTAVAEVHVDKLRRAVEAAERELAS